MDAPDMSLAPSMSLAPDMSLAPTPSWAPSSHPHCEDKQLRQLVYIPCLLIVGVLALFIQHVLGSLRRRSSHRLLHALVLGAYTLSYWLVSYTLGLMNSNDYYFDEFPVWALCLFMLLGGTDSLMACGLNDIDNWKSFYVKHLMQGALVVYMIKAFGQPGVRDQGPLWAILFVNVIQSYAQIGSMRMASKSQLLGKIVKPIDDYMKREHQPAAASGQTPHPETMQGYRYIVAGEHSQKNSTEVNYTKITTVEQIWQCRGSLLSSERGLWLKDVCLSMALSKMLNRRFAGFELAEAGLEKTHDFVFRGLLAGDKPWERAFRVIEVELAFVYDLFYTRYPYLYQKARYFALCLRVTMVTLCSWLTYKLFENFKQDHEQDHEVHDGLLKITLFSMAVVTFLEVFQLYLHMASGWFKVALIQSYVTRPVLQRSGCFSHMIIGLLLRLKALHPWEDKLGQYSLLHNYDGTRHISNCIHYVTLCLVDKDKKGRKRGKPVKLSKQVKQAIVDSLVGSNGHLMNGVRSLRNNGVHEHFSWACDASDGTVTHTILVWHIATAICRHQLDVALAKGDKQLLTLSQENSSTIDTASSLSQYCAYLIAFAPNLLPDHSSHSASILDKSIKEARNLGLLRGAKTMESKCEKLMSISDADDDDAQLVVLGARLALQLTKDIKGHKLRWKVLSDFWAEMMLYVAPCDDAQARAHLEALARGGEFITHLWALLTHAGVLKRGPAGPLDAV